VVRSRQQDHEPRHDSEAPDERHAPPPAAALLALQRGAGHAAVTRMLQRVVTADPFEKAREQMPDETPSTTKDYEWDDTQGTGAAQKRRMKQEDTRLHGAEALPNEVDYPNFPVERQIAVKHAATEHGVSAKDAVNVVKRINWALEGASAGGITWGLNSDHDSYLQWFPLPLKAGPLNINWEIVNDWVNPGLRGANASHGKKKLQEIRDMVSTIQWGTLPNGQTQTFTVRATKVVVKRFGDDRYIWTVYGG
jgi:hypothetical protein